MLNRNPKNDKFKNKLTFEQQTNSEGVQQVPSYDTRMYFLFRKKLKLREIEYMAIQREKACIVTFSSVHSFKISFEQDYVRVRQIHSPNYYEVWICANTIDDVYRKLYRFQIITLEQYKMFILDKAFPKTPKFKKVSTRSQYLDERIEEFRKAIKRKS